MYKGKIVEWNAQEEFGFIAPTSGGNQVFVHSNAFPQGTPHPKVGSEVSYINTMDSEGRLRAENVKYARSLFSIESGIKALSLSFLIVSLIAAMAVYGLIFYLIIGNFFL